MSREGRFVVRTRWKNGQILPMAGGGRSALDAKRLLGDRTTLTIFATS
jgi:hypothetical protein